MKPTNNLTPHNRGYTLVELLVVVAVLGMLLTLLSPAIQAARAAARSASCVSNLHGIGLAYQQYGLRSATMKPLAPGAWTTDLTTLANGDLPSVCPDGGTAIGTESMYCRVTHGGWPEQSIQFQAGPRCLKKNVTATSYELWFEDWNNWDFADLRLLVEKQLSGNDKITVILLDSSSTFDIMSGDGLPVMPGLTSKNWRGRSCDATRGAASYGINNRCDGFRPRPDGQKILLLDYSKKIADVVGPDARDQFSQRVAARHNGRVNVLRVNGAVTSLNPDDIDPAVLAVQDALWKPMNDPALAK